MATTPNQLFEEPHAFTPRTEPMSYFLPHSSSSLEEVYSLTNLNHPMSDDTPMCSFEERNGLTPIGRPADHDPPEPSSRNRQMLTGIYNDVQLHSSPEPFSEEQIASTHRRSFDQPEAPDFPDPSSGEQHPCTQSEPSDQQDLPDRPDRMFSI